MTSRARNQVLCAALGSPAALIWVLLVVASTGSDDSSRIAATVDAGSDITPPAADRDESAPSYLNDDSEAGATLPGRVLSSVAERYS